MQAVAIPNHVAHPRPASSALETRAGRVDPDWIVVRHPTMPSFHRPGLACAQPMPRGTLYVELPHYQRLDQAILVTQNNDGSVVLARDGRDLVCTLRYAQGHILARMPIADMVGVGMRQIALRWDAFSQRATLAWWQGPVGAVSIQPAHIQGAPPMSLLRAALMQPALPSISAALARSPVPLGPLPGFDEAAIIDTPTGAMPIAELRAGDSVRLADGSHARAVWAGAVTLPATEGLRLAVLRAPYWGVSHDLRVCLNQQLSLSGSAVEYLFATRRVRVPVSALGLSGMVRFLPRKAVRAFYGLVLDRPGQLIVNGAAFEAVSAGALLASGHPGATVLSSTPPAARAHLNPDIGDVAPLLGPHEIDDLLRFQAD